MAAEIHYVILPSLHRFKGWALDNLKDEEWSCIGPRIRTATKEYRAVTNLHHLRGASVTPETLHWASGWYMGRTDDMNHELEQYAAVAIACGELRR